jgi:hypothetical protein
MLTENSISTISPTLHQKSPEISKARLLSVKMMITQINSRSSIFTSKIEKVTESQSLSLFHHLTTVYGLSMRSWDHQTIFQD